MLKYDETSSWRIWRRAHNKLRPTKHPQSIKWPSVYAWLLHQFTDLKLEVGLRWPHSSLVGGELRDVNRIHNLHHLDLHRPIATMLNIIWRSLSIYQCVVLYQIHQRRMQSLNRSITCFSTKIIITGSVSSFLRIAYLGRSTAASYWQHHKFSPRTSIRYPNLEQHS